MRSEARLENRAHVTRNSAGLVDDVKFSSISKGSGAKKTKYVDPVGQTVRRGLKTFKKISTIPQKALTSGVKAIASTSKTGRKVIKAAETAADAMSKAGSLITTAPPAALDKGRFVGVLADPGSAATRAGLVVYPREMAWVDEAYALSVGAKPPTQHIGEAASILEARKAATSQKAIASAVEEAADKGLKGIKAEQYVLKKVPDAEGFVASSGKRKGGLVVNMKKVDIGKAPKVPVGQRVFKSLPFVGGAFDVYEGVDSLLEGNYLEGLAHFGDGALGLSGVGDIFNIGANLLGYEGAASMVYEVLPDSPEEFVDDVTDAAEYLANLQLETPEEIERKNSDPTEYVYIAPGGPGGGFQV
jgi:hypothetical protein